MRIFDGTSIVFLVFRFCILFLFVGCSKGGDYQLVRAKKTITAEQRSKAIPVYLVYGLKRGKERSINVKEYLFDGWLMNNLSYYRTDMTGMDKYNIKNEIILEEGDVIVEMTYYNSKYYTWKFFWMYYLIGTSLENYDDKILATGYVIKGSNL